MTTRTLPRHAKLAPRTNPRTARRARLAPRVDALEPRQLLANVPPTGFEQYMIELVNRARSNPAAEAARLGINLFEGLAPGAVSIASKQPLVTHPNLIDSARGHAQWLRGNSRFQHAGANGSTPQQRMANAWYQFVGDSGSAENLGLTLGSSLGDMTKRVEVLYRNLFVDAGVAGRGHRTTMLNDTYESVGVGLATGPYRYNDADWTAVIADQNFAYQSGNAFLTGVVFDDNAIRADQFYTPGEGMGAVTLTARAADGQTYNTTTNIAGSYNFQLPPGTYRLTATNSRGTVTEANVVVGAKNVKRDFRAAQFVSSGSANAPTTARLDQRKLTITGSVDRDLISVTRAGELLLVTMGNYGESFAAADVDEIVVDAGAGDDYVVVGDDVIAATLRGGAGDDSLVGTDAADSIVGGDGDDVLGGGYGDDTLRGDLGADYFAAGAGRDWVYGGSGDDYLNGNGGNDRIYGEAGNDRVYAGDGNDRVEGGGNVDRVFGGEGDDTLVGGSSNDRLYGELGDDLLTGSAGTDYFSGGGGDDTVGDRNDDLEDFVDD